MGTIMLLWRNLFGLLVGPENGFLPSCCTVWYWLHRSSGLTWEHQRLCLTHNQCEEILQSMKSGLRQAENQHQLGTYQNWLDARSLQNSSHPLAVEYQAFTSCFSKTWSCS
ncbi:rho guanine nucleotide exchange factor 11-like isoform X2 [Podarcis muralis]